MCMCVCLCVCVCMYASIFTIGCSRIIWLLSDCLSWG